MAVQEVHGTLPSLVKYLMLMYVIWLHKNMYQYYYNKDTLVDIYSCLYISKLKIYFFCFSYSVNSTNPDPAPKRARYCRSRKNSMKGHKNVKDCPRNMYA